MLQIPFDGHNSKNDKFVGFTEVSILDGIFEDQSPAE